MKKKLRIFSFYERFLWLILSLGDALIKVLAAKCEPYQIKCNITDTNLTFLSKYNNKSRKSILCVAGDFVINL